MTKKLAIIFSVIKESYIGGCFSKKKFSPKKKTFRKNFFKKKINSFKVLCKAIILGFQKFFKLPNS